MSSGFDRLGANVKGKNLDGEVRYVTIQGARKAGMVPPVLVTEEAIQVPPADVSVTLLDSETVSAMSRDQAIQMGFTGDQCDNCQSMKMQVTGHCATCAECGTTTGCS